MLVRWAYASTFDCFLCFRFIDGRSIAIGSPSDPNQARLKALRGEGPSGTGGASEDAGGGGIGIDPEVEARLKALRGDAPPPAAQPKESSYTTKGYDSD